MQALGSLSPILSAEAKIQERVAKFLTMKAVIVRLMKHPSLSISAKASGLLTIQTQLEAEMQNVLATVEKLKKAGVPTFSELAYIGDFAYSMEKHISNVQNLEKMAAQAGAGLVDEQSFFTKPVGIALLFGLGAALIYAYK